MSVYRTKPQNFGQLLKQAIAGYPKVFQVSWYLYLIFIIFGSLMALLLPKLKFYSQTILAIVVILIEIFIYAVILYLSHNALAGKSSKLKDGILNAKKRYLPLLGTTLILIISGAITIALCVGIVSLGRLWGLQAPFMGIAFLLLIFVFFLFYFFYPIIILENQGIIKSLKKSMELFLLNSWHVAGMIIFIILVAIPFAVILMLLPQKVSAIMQIIFNFLIYPLTFSTILVLLHDCNVRLKMREKRKHR